MAPGRSIMLQWMSPTRVYGQHKLDSIGLQEAEEEKEEGRDKVGGFRETGLGVERS